MARVSPRSRRRRAGRRTPVRAPARTAASIVQDADASLLDLVDNLLNHGVILTGDLVLGLADVDLVYLRLSVLLCAADRALGPRAKDADLRA